MKPMLLVGHEDISTSRVAFSRCFGNLFELIPCSFSQLIDIELCLVMQMFVEYLPAHLDPDLRPVFFKAK